MAPKAVQQPLPWAVQVARQAKQAGVVPVRAEGRGAGVSPVVALRR